MAVIPHRSKSPPRIRRKPSFDLSFVGVVYCAVMLFMGLAAVNSQVNLLFGVFGLMIGVLIVSGIISRSVLRGLEVRRDLPEFLVVGKAASIQYELKNSKHYLPSVSVTVGELSGAEAFSKQPQAYLLHAAAGMQATVPMEVLPMRRGVHQFDRFQLSTSFPFGFIRRSITRSQKDSILVHPPLARVDSKLMSLFISADRGGARMKPRRGGSDEFYGVKEYRQGENPRWIYWRRSARTGTLVAKEMSHVAPPRIVVIIDTHIGQRTMAAHAAVEQTIAMAASLVMSALDQGLAVGLVVWSGEPVIVPPNRGKRHARELLSTISRLPLNTKQDLGATLDAARAMLRENMTPAVFTPVDVDLSLSEQARGHWILIPVGSELARRSFRFAPEIVFEQCIPPEQVPAEM